MRVSKSVLFGLLLAILMFMPIPLTMINGTTDPTSNLYDSRPAELKFGKAPIVPGPDLVESNWTSNRFQNPDFEDWNDPTDCAGWDVVTSPDRYSWAAQAPHPVNEGTYSGGIQVRDVTETADLKLRQNEIGADIFNLTLSFDWYLDQVADPSQDFFRIDVEIVDTGPGPDYNIHYYLNETAVGLFNQTLVGHYIINDPPHQWNQFSRNLTYDFIQIPTFPGSVWSTLEVDEIVCWLRAKSETSTYVRAYVDDMRLINATNNYEWINGSVRNGNFETGDLSSWDKETPNMNQGFIESSTTAVSGTLSANVTANSLGNESFVYFLDAPEARLTSLNPGIMKFQWRLNIQNPNENTTAVIHLRANDGTSNVHIYYLLTYYGLFSPYSNSSIYLVLRADNFNTTGSWNTFERIIWNDAMGFFSGNELHIDSFEVEVYAWGPNSQNELLLDQALFRVAAVNGAGFEDQPAVGERIRGWWRTLPTFLVTDETPTDGGLKAANLTLSSGSFTLYQTLQWRPLNGTRETYLDVMWNINDTVVANQVWFQLRLTDRTNYWNLNYYMNGPSEGSNSTMNREAHFNVTSSGTTGSWIQMHRDLNHDYESVFGALPDLEMYSLYLRADTTGGGRLEILFDDLYIYDDPAPRITNVSHDPVNPGILQDVNVTAEVVDQDLTLVELDYRVYIGSWSGWTNIEMNYLAGNTYNATIPGQVSGAVVQYNISATDAWGLTTVSLDNGIPWSYTVEDVDPPSINSVDQDPTTVRYTDPVDVTANVTDGGLISSVKLFYTTNGWTTSDNFTMTHTTGDLFVATIPAQSYGTTVQYYVNASDSADNWTVDDNGGSYYSYTVIDDIDPVISDVSHSPDPVEYDDSPITVTCTVSDPGSGVVTVTLYYSTDGWASSNPVSMTGTDTYTGNIPGPFATGTTVLYNISATDGAGNSVLEDNSGLSYSFTVEDNTDPQITNVGHSPDPVEADDVDVTVSCDVVDPGSGVNTITLWYRLDGGSWLSLAMTHTTGDQYQADIPAQSFGTFVEYYIVAIDNAANSATEDNGGSYYSYTVTDPTPPVIMNVSHTPTPVEYTDSPVVGCDVTDAGSGVNTVTLYYRVNGGSWLPVVMIHTTGDRYEGTIPIQSWNDIVQYFINATDNMNNWSVNDNAGSYYSYTVQDNTDPLISNIDRTPTNVEYTDAPVVSCDASDVGSDIDRVRLRYRINGGAWTWVTMTHTTGDTYEYTFSLYGYDTLVEYYFEARDNALNVAIDDNGGSYYSYRVGDYTDPGISNVDQTPLIVEYDDSPIVGCDVTDAGSGVSTVVLYYRVDGAGWLQVAMGSTGGNHYEGSIPIQSWNSDVEYYVNATDVAGNWVVDNNGGAYYGYTVTDITDPIISGISHTPLVVTPSDSVVVGCDVSDSGSGVSSVQLHYRIDGSGWTTVAMSHTTGNHYEGTIPAQVVDSFVEYYVDATDNAANNAIDDNGGSFYSYTVGDNVPPEISNVGHSPSTVEYDDSPVVSCDVVDIGTSVASVVLAYRLDGGSWAYVAMSHTTGDRYEYTLSIQPLGTFVEYFINATDIMNNWIVDDNGGLYYSYMVVDNTSPEITDIDSAPLDVEYSDTPTVGCDVTDVGSGIQSAILNYRVDGGSWMTLTMSFVSGTLYEVSLPAQAWEAQVIYYFNVTDNAGNWVVDDNGSSYYSYSVIDTTNPLVSITSPEADTTVFGLITITMSATDPGSGIARIEISVDGTEVTELTSQPFSYSWNTTLVTDGEHTITVTAYDTAGNQATDSINIDVLNYTTPQPPIPGFPIEAIILVLVTILVGILVYRRRRK
jgi:hypothetical protein